MKKMLTSNHVWWCCSDGYWRLGIRKGDEITDSIASVRRMKNGSHDWRIVGLPFLEGTEPSREAAFRAVNTMFVGNVPAAIHDMPLPDDTP